MFLGIDVHQQHLTIAALNRCGEIIGIYDLPSLEDFSLHAQEAFCWMAIDGPDGLNHGLMNDEEYRASLGVTANKHYNKKVSEYLLTIKGIRPFSTPMSIDEVGGWKTWMTTSFSLFDGLRKEGFLVLNENNLSNVAKGMVEVFPHGSFTTLLGYVPKNKLTCEGLEDRKKVLREHIANVDEYIVGSKKAMSDQLDALIAAFTVYQLYKGNGVLLGDPVEGQVALPVTDIYTKYRRKD